MIKRGTPSIAKKTGSLSGIKAPRARGLANRKAQGTEDDQAPPANAAPTNDRAQTRKVTTAGSTKRSTNMGGHYDWKPIQRGSMHSRSRSGR